MCIEGVDAGYFETMGVLEDGSGEHLRQPAGVRRPRLRVSIDSSEFKRQNALVLSTATMGA
jgi:hypothetical protein